MKTRIPILTLAVLLCLAGCEGTGTQPDIDTQSEWAPQPQASLVVNPTIVNGDFEAGPLSFGWMTGGTENHAVTRIDDGTSHVARIEVGSGPTGDASCTLAYRNNFAYLDQSFTVPKNSVVGFDFRIPDPIPDPTEDAPCGGYDRIELDLEVVIPDPYVTQILAVLLHDFSSSTGAITNGLILHDFVLDSRDGAWFDEISTQSVGAVSLTPGSRPGWWHVSLELTDQNFPWLPDEVAFRVTARNEDNRFSGQDFLVDVDNVVVEPWAYDPDFDGDGISNVIDTQPYVYSNDFWSVTGGGSIVDRGDQTFWITEGYSDPEGTQIIPDWFYIATLPGGGPTPALVSVTCPKGIAHYTLHADEWTPAWCGSISTRVDKGTVEAEFEAEDGSTGDATLKTGQTLTFHGESFTFEASGDNGEPIQIRVADATYEVNPGKALRVAEIDIKPGSSNNTINATSRGVTPVALLTTALLDATSVDPGTLAFGPMGATPAHGGHLEDADGDGDLDLLLHFRTRDIGLEVGTESACLVGALPGGGRLEACDRVRLRGGR